MIPLSVTEAIKIIEKCFGGVEVKILDDDLSRKYPNEHCPLGYLGITITINGNRVFLKNEDCEHILESGSTIAEWIVYETVFSEEAINTKRLNNLHTLLD